MLQLNGILPVDPNRLTESDAYELVNLLVQQGRAFPLGDWSPEIAAERGAQSFAALLG